MDRLFRIQEEFERRIIIKKLQLCNWNKQETALQFRIPVHVLDQKMKRLKIEERKD